MNGFSAALLWFGGLALHGLAFPLTPPTRAALALCALAAASLPRMRELAAAGGRAPRAAALLLAGLGWWLLPPAPLVRGPLLALAAAALEAPAGAAAALAGASLLTSLAAAIPGLAAAGVALAAPLRADPSGPSAAGVPLAAWALVFLLPRLRAAPRSRLLAAAAIAALALPLAQPLAEFWHARLGPYSGAEHAGHNHPLGLFARLPFAAALLGAAVALAWSGGRAGAAAAAPALAGRRGAARMAAAAAAGFALAAILGGWRAPGEPDRRLAVLNVGGIDWDRPNWEEFGAFSGGMFGLLPAYLRDAGWSVEPLGEADLPGFGLARARVLLLINCHRAWSAEERGRIEAFLRDGGSLLVLGDHTDVFGLMRGFNSLTAPWGVEFRYDSAYHDGAGWADDVAWLPGTLGAWRDPRAANVGIGASLALRPPARALLSARFAFGDHGEPENVMGSYLGNYAHDPGERVGDLALIAERRFGRGRAVFYGDTSGFQNGALSASFASHVAPVLETLARPEGFALPFAVEAALALLGAAAALAALARGTVAARALLIAGGLGWALGGALPPAGGGAAGAFARADLSRALLIDESALPEIGHYDAEWNSPGPLVTCAQRSGLQAWNASRWDGEAVRRARAIALIAPREPLGAGRSADLDAALERGATVFIAASGGDDAGVRGFLARHGVSVQPNRLGPVPPPGRQDESEPRFLDASPLRLADGVAAEEFYRYGEHLIAAAVPAGAGKLVVIGDTRFFSATNVEGTWGWWGGNLRFLHDLLAAACGVSETPPIALPAPVRPPEDP